MTHPQWSWNMVRKMFSNCASGTPGGTSDPLRGGPWGQNYFVIMLNYYLPFLLSFSHRYTTKFSRHHMTWDIATDWMQKQIWESSWLLLSQTSKRYAEMQQCLSSQLSFVFVLKNTLFSQLNNKKTKQPNQNMGRGYEQILSQGRYTDGQ